jgi:NTE family protein
MEAIQESLFASVAAKPPARGSLRPASPRLLAQLTRHPSRINPRTLIAAGFPPGRRSLADVVAMVEDVAPPGGWCAREGVLLTGYDLDTGERVLFGGPGSPGPEDVGLAAAVWASCALPGWFAPLEVAGRRYVDGGAWSVTNADVAAGRGLDEVYVLVPMVSFEADRPRTALGCAERAWRRANTRRLEAELRPLRIGGTTVRVLAPGRADLGVIGPNLLDAARRADVLTVSRRTSRVALRLAAAATP